MTIDMSCLESDSPLFGVNDELSSGLLTAPSFELPSTIDLDGSQKEAKQTLKPAKGTTTLAFIFKEGVMSLRILERAWEDIYSVKKIIEIILTCLVLWLEELLTANFGIETWASRGRLKGTRFSVGSGSPYAYGVLDNGYRYDMSIAEGAELARRAIYNATFQDGASGGVASIYYVGPNGWKTIFGEDVGELHYKYYPVVQGTVEQEMIEFSGA